MSGTSPNKSSWIRPDEVMALHRLKVKKRALQARMNRTCISNSSTSNHNFSLPGCSTSKRKNPFLKDSENKKPRTDNNADITELQDDTLYKLLYSNKTTVKQNKSIVSDNSSPLSSFANILSNLQNSPATTPIVKQGEEWIPVDWTLKEKLRLMSPKPFAWNRKLKTSEEASGITGFVRCLDTRKNTSLDTSPNAQFHQCCLYWQHPSLPWLQLFPRVQGRVSTTDCFVTTTIKTSLHSAWTDSFKSLFQLVRARQCPYFYVCSNSFTAVFRAAGICGHSEMHVLLTPTARGFRQLLRQEDIAFTMPLKNKRRSLDGTVDLGYDSLDVGNSTNSEHLQSSNLMSVDDDEDDTTQEQWLESMGVHPEEIKKINNIQAKINHRAECEIDNTEQSLIFVEGVEAHALHNFLMNCKSIVATTGPLAGVPPTLLAPVAFRGASLQSLKVREQKIHDNNHDYFSLELLGPILPHTIHNLYSMLSKDCSVSATFANISKTSPFSKVKMQKDEKNATEVKSNKMSGSTVFSQENLSDCGLNKEILHRFCSSNPHHYQQYDSLKFNSDTGLYIWM